MIRGIFMQYGDIHLHQINFALPMTADGKFDFTMMKSSLDLLRRIKYQWLSFDAYLCFQNLKERLLDVLQNVGIKYDFIF